MKKIGLHELRREFLDFFEEKNHLILSSFPLVPKGDKSLLLINAGMAPLKPYFTGEKTPPKKRVVTCQKCIRTADIENVGKTDRHATFFEMLGNFSFGDYFKDEAIEWAWEFMTERLNIPEEDLWVSVYEDDDEAYNIWHEKIDIPKEKIVRLGKEDNFWELEVGPGGPCSEIYVDRGEKYGCGKASCKPGCECDRFTEIWNLVFSQYDKDENGNYNPLPNPNIDTGMGLERIAAIMEGADNIFEIEEIKKIVNEIEKVSNIVYGEDLKDDESIRVITDHTRAAVFLVSDGVLPSNEGRGYVLRRLIRRASRHGKLLGIKESFLHHIVTSVVKGWKEIYPEIAERQEHIKKVITAEEEKFEETIHQGLNILNKYMEEMKENEEEFLSGEKAFKLYDTYGFPLDLTKEILEEKGLLVDEKAFNNEMEKQRERARKARSKEEHSGWVKTDHFFETEKLNGLVGEFNGYNNLEVNTKVLALIKDGDIVESLNHGEQGIVVLERTPFYPEGGGQVGDKGIIKGLKFSSSVIDTKSLKQNIIGHFVEIKEGIIRTNDEVTALVDKKSRTEAMRNHSATHLLHRALKDILGDHVEQAGSLVLPNRLRFDFTHYESLSSEELKKIEEIVNLKIFEDLSVYVEEKSLKEAESMGAAALFEDKYKDEVRVVKMGDYSIELCGGTHVKTTSEIGMFKIVGESSIASGVRRIEAVTGSGVYEYLTTTEEQIQEVSNILKANKNNLSEKANSLIGELKEKDKEIESLKARMASSVANDILDQERVIDSVPVITYKVNDMDMDSLRNLGDELRQSLDTGIIVLASVSSKNVSFVSMVSKDLVDKGFHAGNMIREVAKVTGGGGGGRPNMAQAGGKDPSKVDEALKLIDVLIKEKMNKY